MRAWKEKEGKKMHRKGTVPLDGSELAESVLPHLGAFIKRFNLSDVTLVRIVESGKYCFVESCAEASALARKEADGKLSAEDYLSKIVNRISYNGTRFHTEVIVGPMPDTLIDFVQQSGTEMVLMATHGYSALRRWFRRNVTREILRSVEVPVFVMERDYRSDELKKGPFFLLRFSLAYGFQLFHSTDGQRVTLQ
jgi:nucleotide-binding universal stress UspA family protein